MSLKHSPDHCTVCRDYDRHALAKRPLGRWWRKLGTVHRARGGRFTACGRKRAGKLWSREWRLVDCVSCIRARPHN